MHACACVLGYFINLDIFRCPKSVHNREVPQYGMYNVVQCTLVVHVHVLDYDLHVELIMNIPF